MRKKLLSLCLTALLSVVSTAAWALTEEGGFYQIGSAADYAEFAALVNGGQKTINAILTADIDLGTDIDTYKIYVSGDYEGVFDGAGHTITFDFADGSKDNQGPALFRSIGNKAIVKRLKLQGSLTTSRQHAAAIANYSGAVIRDCWAEVSIKCPTTLADASAAALVGQCNRNSVIENCLAKISVDAPGSHKFGGVAAWADDEQKTRNHFANNLVLNDNADFDWSDGKSAGLVRNDKCLVSVDVATYSSDSYHNRPIGACANNYVLDDWGALNKGTEVVTSADVAGGKVCFMLNSDQSQIRWTQNLETDPYPVPAVFREGGQVYASAATNCQGKAEGEVTFSNTASNAVATPHTYKFGICTTCGQFNWNYFDFDNPTKFDLLDRSFIIKEGSDFFVAEGWNRFHNGLKFNLKLANDVTCKPESGQVIFNTNDWIESSFYGQNHTLTIEMVDITEDFAALFPHWYSSGKVIENLTLHGTIGTSARNAGSLIGRDHGTDNKVRNVFSDVTINTTHIGDCSHGGFLNCGGTRLTFDNCIYAGDINGVEGSEAVGGFCGWANGTNYFNNCAFIGTLNNFIGDTHTIARNPGQARCTNVYSVYVAGETDLDKYTAVDAEAVASGELAYRLNGEKQGIERFYQLIGTDPEPMPIKKEGALVYASGTRCDGAIVSGETSYANTFSEGSVPSHQFDDGICAICGDMDENYMTPVDGWYEIGTPAQLMWWACYAAKKDLSASARLTADIDMEDYTDTYPDRAYPQVGLSDKPFTGNFDGQFHTISNLKIDGGTNNYVGLIGAIGNGVVIKNFVFDGTCSVSGNAFCGIVGGTSGSGDIYIENVGNEGVVKTTNQNAAGILGVDQGGSMTLHIKNCWVTGQILGGRESGAICGYSSNASEVVNCWSTASIPQSAIYSNDSFTRGGASVINCYEADLEGVDANKQQHKNPADERRRVNPLALEEVESGALCFNLNGKQFRTPEWYQTFGEDNHPTPDPTHGIVIYGAENYFSVLTDEDIDRVAPVIQTYEEAKSEEEIVATQALIDDWKLKIEALTSEDASTISGFANAYDAVEAAKAAIQENAAVYQAYIDKCEEVRASLENDQTFGGPLRAALEYYLNEDAENGEPTEDNPLGLYAYIIEEHVATAEEITAETERVVQWLQDAIAGDYGPGTDVSRLIPNSDFAEKNAEHWTGVWCNAYGEVANTQTQNGTIVGVEAWNSTGDMYQTVEGMKPGYYLVGTNGAFRPSNKTYSTNYAAGIYANGIFNYFPAVVEDYVAVADTIDQVNCNLHGQGSSDFKVAIYDDLFSTSEQQAADNGATLLGYGVSGAYGMAAAANAGRYQAYTIAYVGEDGKLTIGIKNPGTKYSTDWTGWSAIKVSYCGDDAELSGKALDDVLANMAARARTIIAYEIGEDIANPAETPNFPAELKASLQQAVDAIDAAETVDAKVELAANFSDLFQKVYEGKQAYVKLFNYATTIQGIGDANLPLVEKDEVLGGWKETGGFVFTEEEAKALFDAGDSMFEAFREGTYSTEEALNPVTALDGKEAEAVATIVPVQDEDGYFLLSNPKQFVAYRGLVNSKDNTLKGKLANDIDMAGIGMQSFTPGKVYSGTFDGQGYALQNVTISHYGEQHTALFWELQNATVKNLKLTGEYYSDQQRMAGLSAWTSGTTKIENCEIAVALYSEKEGDGTHGGIMAVHGRGGNCTVNNCIVACSFIGPKTVSVGGVCGWRDATLRVQNTLILSHYDLAAEPSNYATAIVSRNGYTDGGNVFYAASAKREGCIVQSTLATDEQLASGEICYKLNGDQSAINWYQTLGDDEHPMLFGDHLRVWFVNGEYTNKEPVSGDLNDDGKIDIADAVTVLNAMAGDEPDMKFDVNGDGKVDIADFVSILNMMAEQ